MNKSKNSIIGAFLGTIIEYYDYSLYGFSAGIIANKFFHEADHLTNLTNVFALYASAYLFKPFGSIIFGIIGDLYGRKVSLRITILGIALPTAIIGLTPEYASIGALSTAILIICRLGQSLFIGGEYDGAAIYIVEHFGKQYYYTASALIRSTGVVGILLGIGATNLFNSHIFPDYAWRIPFLLSLPLSFIALYYRSSFLETPDFETCKNGEIKLPGLLNLLKRQWQNILMVIIFSGGFGATYQISVIFMKQYLPIIIPSSSIIISSFSILLVFCFGVSVAVSGFCADKFGKSIVIKLNLFSTFVASLLFIIGIKYQMLNLVLAASVALAISVAPFNALAHGIFVKIFPVKERYRCISIGHAIGSMLMSGPANYVSLIFIKNYHYNLFPILYVCFFVLIICLLIKPLEKKFIK